MSFLRRFASTASSAAKMSNVFFDITKNGSPMGRIVFKLYDECVLGRRVRSYTCLLTGCF